MSSYLNIFSGDVVNPAPISYNKITLDANKTLSWPTQFQHGNNITASNLKVSPTANGFTLTMPDARVISVGQSVLIINTTAHSFILNKNDNTLLSNINATSLIYLILDDNTTQGGTWLASPFGSGGTAVTSVAAVSANPDITIAGSPITVAGTFTFNLAGNLLSLSSLTPPGGITAMTGANTFALRTITGTVNQIVVDNGGGIANNPVISLDPNIKNITSLELQDLSISENKISARNANGHVLLSPLGVGSVDIVNPASVPADSGFSSLVSLSTGGAQNIALSLPVSAPLVGQVMTAITGVSPYQLGWETVATIVGGVTVNAAARFANVGGSLKNSEVIIDDNGNVSLQSVNFSNLAHDQTINLSANTATSTYNLFLPPTNGAANTIPYLTDTFGHLAFTNDAITINGITRAWGNVNAAGVLQDGYNVTVAKLPGVGAYEVTLPIPFGNTHYAVTVSPGAQSRVASWIIQNASTFEIHITDLGGALQDTQFAFSCSGN